MNDDEAMRLALQEAERAIEHEDVPVGALVIVDGLVIAARHNERQLTGDPTAHAEILALRDNISVSCLLMQMKHYSFKPDIISD